MIKKLSEYNTQDDSLNYFIMMKDNLEEYNIESEDSE